MKLFAAALVLVCAGPLAHADSDYDQRARLGAEHSQQQLFMAALQNLRKQDASFVAKLANYGATHGGFSSSPNCYSSFGNEDQNVSYEVCSSGLCVTKITDAQVSESDVSDPELGYIKATETFILRCEANLNNGLACSFDEDIDHGDRLEVRCLDAQGNEVKTTGPATSKAKTGRRPVKKKR